MGRVRQSKKCSRKGEKDKRVHMLAMINEWVGFDNLRSVRENVRKTKEFISPKDHYRHKIKLNLIFKEN